MNLEAPKTGGLFSLVTSKFQIAKVTRPLMIVGHKVYAFVSDKEYKEVCRFTRNENGLYICMIKFKKPL